MKKIDIEKIKSGKTIKELLNFSVINLDKPSGPTSFAVDILVKNSLNLSKTSHFGTLDPMVTGVLPVALNRACRLMSYFIGKKKKYVGIMRLHEDVGDRALESEIKNFVGKIMQLPPVKSRVKRQERQREIYSFGILERDGKNALFTAEVEAGTYIRKLIHDLGEKIGGAHMIELRRTNASIFDEQKSTTIFEFLEAVEKYKMGDETNLRRILIPAEIIVDVMPVVSIKKEFAARLQHGSPLLRDWVVEKELKKEDKIAVFCEDEMMGIFAVVLEKDIFARPEFVLQLA